MEFLLLAGLTAGAIALFAIISKKKSDTNTTVIAVSDLSQRLSDKLPSRLAQWATQIAQAAQQTFPNQSDFTLDYWASVIAGILDQESLGGDALTPSGDPSGVGDFANRWRFGPPDWSTYTGNTRVTSKGTLYEILPPQPFDDRPRAWGYGLMQLDYEFNMQYVVSNGWRDAQDNILKGAQYLAKNYGNTGDITSAISLYNGRGDAAALYAQKVTGKAASYGIA